MDAQKTKVILVGNLTFPKWGAEKKDIPNAEQNLELLRKYFVDPNYFGIPDDPQHLVEIKDEFSQEILMRVKHETKSFPDKDAFERLIFYYCGHGIPGEDAKLYFASRDTVRTDYEISSVDARRLYSYLKGFCARELIVILDCCYAAQSIENLGDADSLILKSLPEEKAVLDKNENGIYFLFAADKDNVAKYNPAEPKRPTYFTEALINSVGKGTAPGRDLITIGEIYQQVCEEIAQLKKSMDPDIPDPRSVLQGDVGGFIFCKNIKFKNSEDLDWTDLRSDPSWPKWNEFRKKYPVSRFEKELYELLSRMKKGETALKILLKEKKEIDLAIDIMNNFEDIPYITKAAKKFMDDQAARPFEESIGQVTGAADIPFARNAPSDTPITQDVANSAPGPSAAESAIDMETEMKTSGIGAFKTIYSATARK